jgi:serine/threonine-protein kinase SRPK3
MGDAIVYKSRRFKNPRVYGYPVLCDLGQAQDGTLVHNEDIQPEVYRAPEVILEQEWSYSVDIWNLGVMVSQIYLMSGNSHRLSG